MRLPLTRQTKKEEAKAQLVTEALTLPAYPWWRLAVASLIVVAIAILATSLGTIPISPLTALKISLSKLPFVHIPPSWSNSWETIIWELRLPRVILAGLVGAALAMSGATCQGLFRNPLADPYLVGVAGGAGLGATIVLVSGLPLVVFGVSTLPVAAFLGGITAVTTAYLISRQSEGLPLTTLILAGVAIASLTAAVTSLLMIRSNPDIKPLLGWLLGGFAGTQWRDSLSILPYLIPGSALILAYSRVLNLFQTSEEEARYLGVDVNRSKLILISSASLITAAAVSLSGLIGFVGLIAPHIVRRLWGPDHRFLLPMCILVGASFLILADLVARTLIRPAELPVGIVTAFCGAPFFLYLLRTSRKVLP